MKQHILFVAHHYLWFIPLGFFAGAYGTLIGAGGRTVTLALVIIAGAQLGAWLSNHIHGTWIIRGLAVALGLAGVRLVLMAWW